MYRAGRSTEADEFLIAFGRRIRRLRLDRNLSQKQLAHRSGLNYQTIRRLENADHALSTAGLPQLAQALDISLQQLMPTDADYTDQPNPRRLVRYKFDWSPAARQRSEPTSRR